MATAQPQENPAAAADQAAAAPQTNGEPQSQQQSDTQQQASQQPQSQQPEEEPKAAPLPEPKTATRKDIPLKDFMARMDDYAPIIPDAVTNYYMTRAGLPPPPQTDQRLARLLALATQKFVADIAADAYQYSRIRASNSAAANNPMGQLGAAAGLPVSSQGGNGGAGAGGAAGGGVAGGGAAGGARGGDSGKGPALGIQRPGFGGGGQGGGQNRTVLTMEDLGMAVGEYGVNVKRSEFYR
ncbi:hypothetical protein MAPG_06940 [Magnaporthiopsis poae ATCC 64411]|uniref:Transcription initiation factor TFIID subunit 10 n=1 Tax=Magnaporthiopsis poae (strain ATCC 64411 / 73-15) TaxID=644358 RepID=A0A0C4E3E1_MAGP6|nr:hypothetical protein MAPG_06940 [Magnaporthiopsis poae ATCC 64411]